MEFKTKKHIYKLIKDSIQQEDIRRIDIYTLMTHHQNMKQKLTEFKKEIALQ